MTLWAEAEIQRLPDVKQVKYLKMGEQTLLCCDRVLTIGQKKKTKLKINRVAEMMFARKNK